MKSLKVLSNRPSNLINRITILKILEEITFNEYVTKTYLIRKLKSRHDVISTYLNYLENRGIIKPIKSFKITLYTFKEDSREALLIKEFISKWTSENPRSIP